MRASNAIIEDGKELTVIDAVGVTSIVVMQQWDSLSWEFVERIPWHSNQTIFRTLEIANHGS